MTKPMDLSRFRKGITKAIPNMSIGFRDPKTWISTGNYGLNFLLSGDFYKGVPLGKVILFAGSSGSGKSFVVSGNIVKNAQEQGIFVVLIDSENALDESWLKALGVDTSEEKLMKLNMSMIDDVAKVISDFMEEYKSNYADRPDDERPKVLFAVDSLGMLLTPTDKNHFMDGNLKGDMGIKAKQLKALITNCVNMFGQYDISLIATQHTYSSQNIFDPEDVVAGGSGPIFAASMVVAMQKLKLKEDEDGNKVSDVLGIRSVCKVVKTRYSKPFETIKINIPYESGMNPISGLFDLFEKSGTFVREGNRYKYISKKTGEEMKYFRKEWNDIDKMKIVMDEFTQDDLKVVNPTDDSELHDARDE